MAYQARWGPKGFLTSPEKVVPFRDFKTSYTLKADSENDTSGANPTNTRGMEPQTMTFSTTYLRAAGVDPLGQINEWRDQIGKYYPLYIGGKVFGPQKMMLTKVEVVDQLLSVKGEFLKVDLNLTMVEYTGEKTSAQTKSKAPQTSSAAPATSSKATEILTAINATASAADKSARKPR